jgi:hypothetical protein
MRGEYVDDTEDGFVQVYLNSKGVEKLGEWIQTADRAALFRT